MSQTPLDYQPRERTIEAEMGLKPLNKWWAKAEILLGLSVVWLSMQSMSIRDFNRIDGSLFVSYSLFVLGGYLALAGSRSHLYQSSNRQIEFLWRHMKR